MKIKEIIKVLEEVAPLSYQESYDNAGLIVGSRDWVVKGVLLCLDSTEAILDEAIEKGCNLIVAHHPIVFSGLKKINGKNYIERTIIKAIKNDIAIYASHTNLDKVYHNGVNSKIAEKLNLQNTRILAPESGYLLNLQFYVPKSNKEEVLNAMYENGAGEIGNYSQCSFSMEGEGTFRPNENANPFRGSRGQLQREDEEKVEVLVAKEKLGRVLNAMVKNHPYEEIAYYIFPILNKNQEVGLGMVGELHEALKPLEFLELLKNTFNLSVIRHTNFNGMIKKVALCGGSGSSFFGDVIHSNADAYVTADVKYHQFFDPENDFLLADIGHYESEIFTLEIFHKIITENFSTFAVLFADKVTNPVNYF